MSQGLQKQGGRRGIPYPRSWMNRKRQRAAAARRTTTGSVMTNGFFDLPLRHRNTQVKFCLKMVLKFLDLNNFAITNSFYEMHAVHHPQNSQQKSDPDLNVFTVAFLALKK